MLWMAAPKEDFHLFVFNFLSVNRITLSTTFGVGRNLYRRCKYVVYGSYSPPVGDHVITCEPKL